MLVLRVLGFFGDIGFLRLLGFLGFLGLLAESGGMMRVGAKRDSQDCGETSLLSPTCNARVLRRGRLQIQLRLLVSGRHPVRFPSANSYSFSLNLMCELAHFLRKDE